MIVSVGARSTGRMTIRSITTPPANDAVIASTIADQKGRWRSSVSATYADSVASSPWAKLITPLDR